MQRVKRFLETQINTLENKIGNNKQDIYDLNCTQLKEISISDVKKVGYLNGVNDQIENTIMLFDIILDIMKEEQEKNNG